MEQRDIDRIREPKFTLARRGYDQREVDNFLLKLAEWLETRAGDELGSFAIKRKLELVGESTAKILLTTQREADELQRAAEAEALETRQRAEGEAQKARSDATAFAKQVRDSAEQESGKKLAAATAKARSIVDEAERRRAAIEAVIGELDKARERALGEIEKLGSELKSTGAAHRSTPTPDPFADASATARRPKRPAAAPDSPQVKA